jgi:hypothetical protein
LADTTATEILSLIQSRWKFLRTDTIEIGVLLDSTEDPDDFVDGNCDAVVAARIGFNEVAQGKAFRGANDFVNMKRDWTQDAKSNQGGVPPVEWWGNRRKYYRAQFDIVGRICTIPISSAHSNLRNKLNCATFRKLVFIEPRRRRLGPKGDPQQRERHESR